MTTACFLASFLNWPRNAAIAVFSRPHWFSGHRHGFGAGGILVLLVTILVVFLAIRLLTGEGKTQ
jgi:hypothetical protein